MKVFTLDRMKGLDHAIKKGTDFYVSPDVKNKKKMKEIIRKMQFVEVDEIPEDTNVKYLMDI